MGQNLTLEDLRTDEFHELFKYLGVSELINLSLTSKTLDKAVRLIKGSWRKITVSMTISSKYAQVYVSSTRNPHTIVSWKFMKQNSYEGRLGEKIVLGGVKYPRMIDNQTKTNQNVFLALNYTASKAAIDFVKYLRNMFTVEMHRVIIDHKFCKNFSKSSEEVQFIANLSCNFFFVADRKNSRPNSTVHTILKSITVATQAESNTFIKMNLEEIRKLSSTASKELSRFPFCHFLMNWSSEKIFSAMGEVTYFKVGRIEGDKLASLVKKWLEHPGPPKYGMIRIQADVALLGCRKSFFSHFTIDVTTSQGRFGINHRLVQRQYIRDLREPFILSRKDGHFAFAYIDSHEFVLYSDPTPFQTMVNQVPQMEARIKEIRYQTYFLYFELTMKLKQKPDERKRDLGIMNLAQQLSHLEDDVALLVQKHYIILGWRRSYRRIAVHF